MAHTTAELRNLWAPACRMSPGVTFRFWNGVGVPVDGRIVPALKALDSCLLQWNYRPKAGQTFGYACRRITGGSGYSLHAYGVAIDVNSLLNPYGPRLVTDMPPAMVAAIKAIRTRAGLGVWRWGGDFGGSKDAMHYEVQLSPAELAVGIAGSTAPAPPNPAPPPDEEDDMALTDAQAAALVANIEATKNYLVAIHDRQNPRIIQLLEQLLAKP